MIPFLEHEMIYVENDQILVFKPRTGEWALHNILRTCGVDCPIIDEDAVATGQWPQFVFHKLTFLGCHATTGNGHMLVVNPASGNYTIRLFERTEHDPLAKLLAYHQRLEMTQFQVTYAGKDEIILYESNTDKYRVYLVEPRLPTSGEDPVGPFDPLDEGTYSLFEQVIYIGHNHLLTYSATTGEYRVLHYDRGATLSETSFTTVVAQGTINKNLQLTFLGNSQMLGFDASNGRFEAFDLKSFDSITVGGDIVLDTHTTKEGAYYGFGSILSENVCGSKRSCGNCIAKDGCGWCATSETCFRGSLNGPCTTNCTTWELHLCPGEPCHMHRGCTKCLADPFCGWCADSSSCVEGTHTGPLFGSCEYSKIECPIYVPTVEVQAEGCHEEIE